jgi:putative transposase
VIYRFISEHEEHSVARWARFFQVSRSGYYSYKKHRETRDHDRRSKAQTIKRIFDESEGTYGPDRICGVLRRKGIKASYRQVSGMMSELGLKSIHRKHKTRSLTDSRKARGEGYENLVRDEVINKPRQAVCSDITYLKSGEGWVYLCIVKDIATGEILGEAMSDNLRKDLVIQALKNAQTRHRLPSGTIFHSDRGSQYTSKEFKGLLRKYGIKQSFSRVGMPGDNAWAESFFATLKKECIHFRQFPNRDGLKQAVFAWIEGFYNNRRVQARLGYLSPRHYARLLMADGRHAA